MKRRVLAIIIIIICYGMTACSVAEDKASVPDKAASSKSGYINIKPEDAKKRIDNDKGIILVDVRTQEEYEEKHIANSILIPVDNIEKEAPSKLKDKNAAIFVYCRSGRRSAIASETLVRSTIIGGI